VKSQDIELIFSMPGEISVTEIIKIKNMHGFNDFKKSCKYNFSFSAFPVACPTLP
jgi:hypothetical protein